MARNFGNFFFRHKARSSSPSVFKLLFLFFFSRCRIGVHTYFQYTFIGLQISFTQKHTDPYIVTHLSYTVSSLQLLRRYENKGKSISMKNAILCLNTYDSRYCVKIVAETLFQDQSNDSHRTNLLT